jgi:prepilin-type N-terminal cleavage/methylation domain-containing protein/prepilin-type processing-associated H-X9-DG protein
LSAYQKGKNSVSSDSSQLRPSSKWGGGAHFGPPARPKGAFTLVELLLVTVIIAILAALLLPALAGSKAKGQQTACANNLKQLALCGQMYADDNGGKYSDNLPLTGAQPNYPDAQNLWALGNMAMALQATNTAYLRAGEFFPYTSQPALYKCAADLSQANGSPRVRSYSLNGWMGSQTMSLQQGEPDYRTFVKESETAAMGAANLWVLMDEHELTINDAWFLVTMNDSSPFASFPAMRHGHGYNVNFADGHVEHVALRDPGTIPPGAQPDFGSQISPRNTDWLRLKQMTTVLLNQ